VSSNYYDLAFSFAEEDRPIASQIAGKFKSHKSYRLSYRIFYDEWFSSELLGKIVTDDFGHIYGHPKTIIVVFVSRNYLEKEWTIPERRSVIEGKFKNDDKLVIPVILEKGVELPGVPTQTVGYIDFEDSGVEGAETIIRETLADNISVSDEYIDSLCEMANSNATINFGFDFFSNFSDSVQYVNQATINRALSNLIYRKMGVRTKASIVWFDDFSGISGTFGKTEAEEFFGFSRTERIEEEIMDNLLEEFSGEVSNLIGKNVTLEVKDSWSCEEFREDGEYFFSHPKTGMINGLILPASAVIGVSKKSADNSIQPTANASSD